MSSRSDYQNDVVVCFADDDNEVLPGGKVGWISQLVDILQKLLPSEVGVTKPRIRWLLEGNEPQASRAKWLQASATVVIVMSPAYAKSDWCTDAALADAIKTETGRRAKSFFLVEKSPVEQGQLPVYDPFRPLEFWSQVSPGVTRPLGTPDLEASKDSGKYFDAAMELVMSVGRRLQQISGGSDASAARARVFLADAEPALNEQRAQVQRFLRQEGIDVEPSGRLPLDPHELETTMRPLLADSRLFVQLLGSNEHAPVINQLDIAIAAPSPIIQWRDATLDLATVSSARQRALLMRETVRAETITDFCEAVKRIALSPPTSTSRPMPTIFIDTRRDQVAQVEQIFGRINQVQWDWHQPSSVSKLKGVVQDYDGVIIYWGGGESDLTQERFRIFRRHFQALQKGMGRLLIYDGPPPEKPPFKGTNFPVANGRQGDQPAELRRFLQEILRAG